MRIRELITTGRPTISFEFFPPKDETGFDKLRDTLGALRDLSPTFVSVTWGAGGSTRSKTIELVSQIKQDYGMEPMAHLTCVGASQAELKQTLIKLAGAGVQNILALRGDPPRDNPTFEPASDGFSYAYQLVEMIRADFDLCIGGACYPEKHPEAVSLDADIAHLKQKVDAGCEFLVTQLFFDNQVYFDFVAKARAAGIGVPIIPGIMPITNMKQVKRFTDMCGATIPAELMRELDALGDEHHAVLSLGVAHATAQCLELLHRGAPGIHFYTLNRSPATRTILTALRAAYPPVRTPAGS